jgi:hypothetical protein
MRLCTIIRTLHGQLGGVQLWHVPDIGKQYPGKPVGNIPARRPNESVVVILPYTRTRVCVLGVLNTLCGTIDGMFSSRILSGNSINFT